MTQTEVLKLALEALEDMHIVDFPLEDLCNWNKAITAIKEALMSLQDGAQPEQEPVAWITQGGKGWLRWHKSYDDNKDSVPLYTTPPQRPSRSDIKPLTDEQREEIAKGWRGRNWTVGDIIDATEAAHGIKEDA